MLRLFAKSFVQAQIEENIKAARYSPWRGESTGVRWLQYICIKSVHYNAYIVSIVGTDSLML